MKHRKKMPEIRTFASRTTFIRGGERVVWLARPPPTPPAGSFLKETEPLRGENRVW